MTNSVSRGMFENFRLKCPVRGCEGKFYVYRIATSHSNRVEHEVSPGKFIHCDVADQDVFVEGMNKAYDDALEKIAASGHPGYIPPDEC